MNIMWLHPNKVGKFSQLKEIIKTIYPAFFLLYLLIYDKTVSRLFDFPYNLHRFNRKWVVT